ncbi:MULTISPECIES: aminoacyl-histidine dipeptidase [unclassified Lentimicrobium]|uniref:aminoacyl-histidine dipeptidase n=1 Tax=unclassified Lentimicrobium TaxID=2677434 RepID=UPI0015523104|nr:MULTISPECIES: aminoacyl-histidine dipeptidase [unclassified Lentimicrobium]NPD44899.1 aminoacyl-histidine dipeptidase [Lentimicrobium sp. S6]NPD83725.1 aminoacyl-histidine dipeptidase [Lentimicrobium sp. L6]
MSKDINNLNPREIWKHFYSLTQIPRPSKHEDAIQDFMMKFGQDLGLETIKDEVGNIIIKKPATPGMEDRKGVILQGHLDMVPQKNSDKVHDFKTDPIETYVDGEWLTADGTTLGADNGMGVAAAMAVLESKDLVHGPIEALMTADEETGMTGAFGLQNNVLDGHILLNLDSEDEGELYIGCAGGIDGTATFEYKEAHIPKGSVAYKLIVKGLKGGHSGMDIILGRGNSNKIMFRFLKQAAKDYGVRISKIIGGSLRNAIPREAFVTLVVPNEHCADFENSVEFFEGMVQSELSSVEPDFTFTCKETAMPDSVIDEKTQNAVINAVYACPNGVMRMSNDMEGLTETSTNLAIVKSGNFKIEVQSLLRSSVESAKKDLAEMMESVFTLAGAEVTFDGAYPGWKPNPNSEILETMKKVYNDKYGRVPEIKAIHAGLECGLLGAVYPKWDMISFGPTIRNPHSPDEKVNIETVGKFWDFLVETLKNIPKK